MTDKDKRIREADHRISELEKRIKDQAHQSQNDLAVNVLKRSEMAQNILDLETESGEKNSKIESLNSMIESRHNQK